MEYNFNIEIFRESFNAKSTDEKSVDSIRLTHKADNKFKLFPYKASGKTQAPIVTELEDVVSGFFRNALNKKTNEIDFETLCQDLLEEIEIDDSDVEYFKDMIHSVFFVGNKLMADNLGLYPYQTSSNNKSADNLAHFLFSVFGLDVEDCEKIKQAQSKCRFNVLEDMVIKTIENKKVMDAEPKPAYYIIKNDICKKFKDDFYFMLATGMTSLEDFANLFSVYYFYYTSQTCIILDQFCSGKRTGEEKLFFALDWEKVSKNRKCCEQGWDKLQASINHMFSHAMTLEILNQNDRNEMYDYISLGELARENRLNDQMISAEVMKAKNEYCSFIGDFKGFDAITTLASDLLTETAVIQLYKCVEAQFQNTDRRRANQFYNEKFSEFCKNRWVKNRKKSGLVLNLTERDIIFLTKICLRDEEKIRLIDLFKEYELRGIHLDNTSKEYLQEFFTKLNLIDKKSDSGDAQYVKRIL